MLKEHHKCCAILKNKNKIIFEQKYTFKYMYRNLHRVQKKKSLQHFRHN